MTFWQIILGENLFGAPTLKSRPPRNFRLLYLRFYITLEQDVPEALPPLITIGFRLRPIPYIEHLYKCRNKSLDCLYIYKRRNNLQLH
ncbi:hypothetical protein VPHK120G1_0017 [Vibrio phage K120 g1]